MKNEIKDMPAQMRIPNHGFVFDWCCDCGLRHVWHFEIKRGKTPSKDEILASSIRDDLCTDLMRKAKRGK